MLKNECEEWVLTDWHGGPDGDHVYPKMVIHSVDQLQRALAGYAQQEPRILDLERGAKIRLGIGLGGRFGVVEIFSLGGAEPGIALATPISATENVIFVCDWQPSPFPPEFLLPAPAVIEIVLHLYQHQTKPEWVRWESR